MAFEILMALPAGSGVNNNSFRKAWDDQRSGCFETTRLPWAKRPHRRSDGSRAVASASQLILEALHGMLPTASVQPIKTWLRRPYRQFMYFR